MKKLNKIHKQYFLIFSVLLIEIVLAFALPVLELSEITARVIYTTTIIVLLVMIPGVLKFFSTKIKTAETIDKYAKYAQLQMWLLAIPPFVSGLAFYLLRDKSTLFCFLLASVALLFSKPSLNNFKANKNDAEKPDENSDN